MSDELRIRNLNQALKQPHPLRHAFLPNPANMRLLVIARSGSGKTQMLLNMLTRPEFGYADFFAPDRIFLFSETLGVDPSWDALRLPAHHRYRGFPC